jgi:hypothetical protein
MADLRRRTTLSDEGGGAGVGAGAESRRERSFVFALNNGRNMNADVLAKLGPNDFAFDMAETLLALEELPRCTDSERALELYWMLDNNIVLQGALHAAAIKLLPHICELVQVSTDVGRRCFLDLLVEIMAGACRDLWIGPVRLQTGVILEYVSLEWLQAVRNKKAPLWKN